MADDTDLPPINPTELANDEFNGPRLIIRWIVEALLSLDNLDDSYREELGDILRDIAFQNMAKILKEDLFEELVTREMIADSEADEPLSEEQIARQEQLKEQLRLRRNARRKKGDKPE